MKRILYLLLFIIIIFPVSAKANSIDKYYINATLQDNGDLEVEEYFTLEGEYSGYEKILKYEISNIPFDNSRMILSPSKINNATNIKIEKIILANKLARFDFSLIGGIELRETNKNVANYGEYKRIPIQGGNRYIINTSSSQNKAFYFKYTLSNLAVIHNDIGELYWSIFDNIPEQINNLVINIKLPDNKTLNMWIDGNYNGVLKKVNNNKIIGNITNFKDILKIRIAFDKEIIKNSIKVSNQNVLEKIILYENSKQKDHKPLNETEIINKIDYCLIHTSYNCYLNIISNLNPEQINNYNQKLDEIYNKVMIIQKKIVKEKYDTLINKKYYSYKEYNELLSEVRLLESGQLKEDYLNKLEEIRIISDRQEQLINDINMIISFSLSYILLIIIIIYYFNSSKKYKPKYKGKIYNKLPNKYDPIVIDYLINGKLTNKGITSILYKLNNKKIITITKQNNNYILELNTNSRLKLKKEEQLLKELLFGNKTRITLKEFKKECKEDIGIYNYYEKINKNITTLLDKEELIEIEPKTNVHSKVLYLLSILPLILLVLSFKYKILFAFIPSTVILLFHEYFVKKDKKINIKNILNIAYIILLYLSILLVIIISIYCHNNSSIIYDIILNITCIILKIATPSIKKYKKNGSTELAYWKAFNNYLSQNEKEKNKYMNYRIVLSKYKVKDITYIGKKIYIYLLLSSNGLDFINE